MLTLILQRLSILWNCSIFEAIVPLILTFDILEGHLGYTRNHLIFFVTLDPFQLDCGF